MIFISGTSRQDIEESFRGFLKREDIAIILINQSVSYFTKGAFAEIYG